MEKDKTLCYDITTVDACDWTHVSAYYRKQ